MQSNISIELLKLLDISEWDNMLKAWLHSIGITDGWSLLFANLCWFAALVVICWLVRKVTVKLLRKVVSTIPTRKLKALEANKFFKRLSNLIPLVVVSLTYSDIWSNFPRVLRALDKVVELLFVVFFASVVNAIANTIIDLYQHADKGNRKPVKSLVQFAQIIIYFISFIVALSILFGKPPAVLIGGLSAMSAVLILVFKDSILGLVSGVQLSVNNMVEIGDWIVIPKHNTDGDVIDITLTTVKVQNWDKTISTIPTYLLTSEVVINWRGMEEAGGRRIARAINIDMRSVQFCTDDMLEELKKITLAKEYIETTQKEQDEYNKANGIDTTIEGNGRRQTNLGIFRAYMTSYLRSLPTINRDMTLIVRQLAPTETGIPIQIYCFTKTTSWDPYEKAQSDIFDHLLGILPYFRLAVYQNLTGGDIGRALSSSKPS